MFLNLYLVVAVLIAHISWGICYVGYEQFRGFEGAYDKIQFGVSGPPVHDAHPAATQDASTKSAKLTAPPANTTATPASRPSIPPITYPKFNCSEDERPFNIGPYEVPTQRDLVLQIQSTLKLRFSLYQEKALDFLQDIQQATKATSDIEQKCLISHHSHRINYKKCVKVVSKKCEFITKSLVMSLERQRTDVSAFIDGTICNVTEMRADPVQLIKTLAMEQASIEFALPGFLRLLGSCSAYCDKKHRTMKYKKPIRHMTDQDLVVKHFLTKKSYVQLIN